MVCVDDLRTLEVGGMVAVSRVEELVEVALATRWSRVLTAS